MHYKTSFLPCVKTLLTLCHCRGTRTKIPFTLQVERNDRKWIVLSVFLLTVSVGLLATVAYRLDKVLSSLYCKRLHKVRDMTSEQVISTPVPHTNLSTELAVQLGRVLGRGKECFSWLHLTCPLQIVQMLRVRRLTLFIISFADVSGRWASASGSCSSALVLTALA